MVRVFLRSIALLSVLCVCSQAQVALPLLGAGGTTGAASVTPTLVSFRGMPSTEGNAVGTKTNNTCATEAYCTQLPDPTLANNGIIVFYTYKAASGNTANTPTVYDCTTYGCTTTVDTFTHCGTDANDSTNGIYAGCFYVLTATTGSRNITVKWTAGVSQVSASCASFYNVTSADVYATNFGSSASTTLSSGSATSTAAKDLWFEFAVQTAGTMPTNIGLWTPGSQAGITWVADLADRRDATFIQHGVQTSAGALNPQVTSATSNTYVALGVAFKSGSSGTAPSGMYIGHIYTVNSATGGAGNLSYQLPLSGNLGVVVNIGGAMYATAMSDTTNGSWKSCGPPNLIGGTAAIQASGSTFFIPNATSGLLNTTLTTTGTGDIGPTIFYDIVGANSTQLCNHAATIGYSTATSGSYTANSAYSPSSSSGIELMGSGIAFNTGIGCTAPSGCSWDLNTFGGESLSGPEPVDENNMGGGHLNFASNASTALTWTVSSTTTAIDYQITEIASFQAPGATLYPSEVKQGATSSATSSGSITLSYTPYQSGDLLAVETCSTNSSGTITVSDGTNTYTAVDGPSTVGGVYCKTFYAASISASSVTITATYSGGNVTFHNLMVEEFANCSTLDKHSLASKTSNGTTGIITGTATGTLSNANEVIFAGATCSNCDIATTIIQQTTFNGAPYTQENNDGAGNVTGYAVVSATTSVSPTLIDTVTGASDSMAVMTFH